MGAASLPNSKMFDGRDAYLILDVNLSQLGKAQYSGAFRRSTSISEDRKALLAARRGPVVHRATKLVPKGSFTYYVIS